MTHRPVLIELAGVVRDFLERWDAGLDANETDAYCNATLVPALRAWLAAPAPVAVDLWKWTRHENGCGYFGMTENCTCGLDAALSSASQAAGPDYAANVRRVLTKWRAFDGTPWHRLQAADEIELALLADAPSQAAGDERGEVAYEGEARWIAAKTSASRCPVRASRQARPRHRAGDPMTPQRDEREEAIRKLAKRLAYVVHAEDDDETFDQRWFSLEVGLRVAVGLVAADSPVCAKCHGVYDDTDDLPICCCTRKGCMRDTRPFVAEACGTCGGDGTVIGSPCPGCERSHPWREHDCPACGGTREKPRDICPVPMTEQFDGPCTDAFHTPGTDPGSASSEHEVEAVVVGKATDDNSREVCWLAETIGGQIARYAEVPRPGCPVGLTPDPWKAARYSTREAALDFCCGNYARSCLGQMRPAQHVFLGAPPAAALRAARGEEVVVAEGAWMSQYRRVVTSHDVYDVPVANAHEAALASFHGQRVEVIIRRKQ